jgi:hypothetical protein
MALVKTNPPTFSVFNLENGQLVVVKGAGALVDYSLNIRDDIDLTKPIFEQILRNKDDRKSP